MVCPVGVSHQLTAGVVQEQIVKAVRINASAGLDGLDLVDLPDPGAPSPGEIRVRVHASSLNYHDYGVAKSRDPKFQGRIPLSDGAGVVEAVARCCTDPAGGARGRAEVAGRL